MSPTLSFTLATDQVLHVHMSEPQERLTYEALAKHQLALNKEAELLGRTYHLGTGPTPGRGYDDRLTVRLGLCRSTLLVELHLWRDFAGRRGGLRHISAGKKYLVSELAVREYLNDLKAAA